MHRSLENLDPNIVSELVNDLLDWNNKKCPDFYQKSMPNTWNDLWDEVLERREFIRNKGIGEFLLEYYDELVIRVFGYKVTNPQVIENRIRQLYHSWINDGNNIPLLPSDVLKALGLTSTQTLITNFLGSQP